MATSSTIIISQIDLINSQKNDLEKKLKEVLRAEQREKLEHLGGQDELLKQKQLKIEQIEKEFSDMKQSLSEVWVEPGPKPLPKCKPVPIQSTCRSCDTTFFVEERFRDDCRFECPSCGWWEAQCTSKFACMCKEPCAGYDSESEDGF